MQTSAELQGFLIPEECTSLESGMQGEPGTPFPWEVCAAEAAGGGAQMVIHRILALQRQAGHSVTDKNREAEKSRVARGVKEVKPNK